jgi:uncharacterized membrane protein YesL
VKRETYEAIFGGVYAALVANVLLILGCAPLVAGLLVTDTARSWPLLALVAPLCAPAIVGVFAVMASFSQNRSTTPVRTFARAWRAAFRRAVALGALATGALVVLGVDIAWAWGRPVGAVAIPGLAVLIVLAVSTTMLSLVVLAERPAVRLRDALRAAVYLAVRRWYLTAVSLVVLLLLMQVIATRPAIGLGLVAAPLLYVVWANSRFSLRPALDTPTPPAPPASPTVAGRASRGRAAAAGA